MTCLDGQQMSIGVQMHEHGILVVQVGTAHRAVHRVHGVQELNAWGGTISKGNSY